MQPRMPRMLQLAHGKVAARHLRSTLGARARAATTTSAAAGASGGSQEQQQQQQHHQQSGYSLGALLATGVVGLAGGVALSNADAHSRQIRYPPAQLRACCEAPISEDQKQLASKLSDVVGSGNVRQHYSQKGSRLGRGTALAHVSPGTLEEAVKVLELCTAANVAVLPQGANTSLTGGAVPRNEALDRPTVVLCLRRLNKIMPIDDGKRVLCFAGAGIYDLKEKLEKEYHRDSHSVLGSIFLNPTVAAGVAYGSGGTQIRKGPSWTERALFAKVKSDGSIEIVNTLGLKDGGDAIKFLDGKTELKPEDIDQKSKGACSWPDYGKTVRAYNESSVSRSNADTTGLECCRSEGKVMILATMHDTHVIPEKTQLVWVACSDFQDAHELKRKVALRGEDCMSKTCEYMNKEVYNGVDRAGRILVKMIEIVGMQRLEPLWNLKLLIETIPLPFTNIICDKFLWWFNNIIPHPLTPELRSLGTEFEHHLLMELSEYSPGEVDRLRGALDEFVATRPAGSIKYEVLEGKPANRANLWRFVVAPAFRTYCIGVGLPGLSIDYALPKNFREYPTLPEEQYPINKRWVYSHFGCNVYHEDLVFEPQVDVEHAKHDIKHAVEGTGGRLPAEHGHGTEYKAPKAMQDRWKKSDPLNVMNPGVGGTSSYKDYADRPCHQCK
mmetsp:Transcript_95001/g.198543  ORF Transcript_95001/g.198543 Transcript_95001/m.198543 type:complete len:669 (+) Transcript_95001:107-2113(+)|eukprot:CAMPEP_0206443612 /NCGR_PEP_ID=MMETSP0324_2-20121206/14460_1 /ASSEMBLY_ACC=CAM_ASM_000836 /TAXON_ID=2866 /ORGANISM="Crypthecodinium cohnii, Strain Seligo" /LENGTH=668 /DNA_ID=CAMNT_0053911557 /DNA_START=107 /DNA_END=2113 /DNA_ORIENTATION=-